MMQQSGISDVQQRLKESTRLRHKQHVVRDISLARLEELSRGLLKAIIYVSISKGINKGLDKDKRIHMNVLKFHEGDLPVVRAKRSRGGRGLINLTQDIANSEGIAIYKTIPVTISLVNAIRARINGLNKLIKTKHQVSNKSEKWQGIRNINVVNPDLTNNAVRLMVLLNEYLRARWQNNAFLQRDVEELVSKGKLYHNQYINSTFYTLYPSIVTGYELDQTPNRFLIDEMLESSTFTPDVVNSMFTTVFSLAFKDNIVGTNYSIPALRLFLNALLGYTVTDQDVGVYGLLDAVLSGTYDQDFFASQQDNAIPKFTPQNPKYATHENAKYLLKESSVFKANQSNNTLGKYTATNDLTGSFETRGVYVSMKVQAPKGGLMGRTITYSLNGNGDKLDVTFNGTTPITSPSTRRATMLVRSTVAPVVTYNSLSDLNRYLLTLPNSKEYYIAAYNPSMENNMNIDNVSLFNNANTQYILYRHNKGSKTAKTVKIDEQSMNNVVTNFQVKNIVRLLIDFDLPNVVIPNVFNHLCIINRGQGYALEIVSKFIDYITNDNANQVVALGLEQYNTIKDDPRALEVLSPQQIRELMFRPNSQVYKLFAVKELLGQSKSLTNADVKTRKSNQSAQDIANIY